MESKSLTIIKYLLFAFNLVVFVSQSTFIAYSFRTESAPYAIRYDTIRYYRVYLHSHKNRVNKENNKNRIA